MITTRALLRPLRFPIAAVALVVLLTSAGCSSREEQPAPAATSPAAAPAAAEEDAAPALLPFETEVPDGVRNIVDRPLTGDFDEMVKRRMIRVGVTFNRTHYFVDKGTQRGVAYEYIKVFEDELNKTLKTGNLKIHVVFVPLPRDLLLRGLVDGRVDLVVAQLTVTPEREKIVDFSRPTRRNVSEVVVTAPGAPAVRSVEDLSGREVFVRKTSSYYASLEALNETLAKQGKPPVSIQAAPENLEDDDLLEMANAGLIPATVVDDYLAEFWSQVFTGVTVHAGVALRTGANLAVAFRKNSPELAAQVNAFIARHGLNSALYNTLNRKYLQDTKVVQNATSQEERKKFVALVQLFRKYSDQYQLDFLLMAAQGYQESRLDQNAKSHVGAIGVMQVMPATGKELNVGDIRLLEPNIHAGVKYIRFMMDQYYKDEPMDDLNKGMFAFASYNAGPGRIRQLRREAQKRGLNPNIWFGHVERVALARIGRETVTYVSNIYKYYVAYRLVVEEMARREAAKKQLG